MTAKHEKHETDREAVRRGRPVIDLTGRTFGALTVVQRSPARTAHRTTTWSCRCVCGRVVSVPGERLRSGHTASCGCRQYKRRRDLPGEPFYPVRRALRALADRDRAAMRDMAAVLLAAGAVPVECEARVLTEISKWRVAEAPYTAAGAGGEE